MAEVAALPGWRFTDRSLSNLIAPPFDVISPQLQAELYARDPHNVVRLELGRETDPYAEARNTLAIWRRNGVLRQDPPSVYVLRQRFRLDGETFSRRSVLLRVRLEEWSAGAILPHEETHTRAKADRLRLLQAVWANVSPVFALFDDAQAELAPLLAGVTSGAATAEATDGESVEHELWQVTAATVLEQVHTFFAPRRLFIADGHHRYETALALRNGAREDRAHPGATHVMMALTDFADPGLRMLPTHRLIADLDPAQLRRLAEQLGRWFEVQAAADAPSPAAVTQALASLSAVEGPAFVLYGPLPSGLRLLRLKPEWLDHTFDPERSAAWNRLDVSVLHAVLGYEILGISREDAAAQRYFSFVQEPAEALRAVQTGRAQMAILLRGAPATIIRDVSLAGDKMPQKSTYFYPKQPAGLVINPLDQ
ncbi:MAG: DUF1015 domain-containing protein [Chloroflexota bacterium]